MRNQWETDLHKFITPYLKALTNNIQRRWAPLYLRGLLSRSRRKSIYPLAGTIAIGRFQNLHHFVNVASWNTHPPRDVAGAASSGVSWWERLNPDH